MTTIIGVAGPSCSGKSTAAKTLAEIIGARVFHYDDYYMKNAPSVFVNGFKSFERPDLYDAAALAGDILRQARHEPGRPIVAEGFMLFAHNELRNAGFFDVKFFVNLDSDTVLRRRIQRRKERAIAGGPLFDEGNQRKFEESFLANGIEEWEKFGAQQANLSDVVVLNGAEPTASIIDKIVAHPVVAPLVSRNALSDAVVGEPPENIESDFRFSMR